MYLVSTDCGMFLMWYANLLLIKDTGGLTAEESTTVVYYGVDKGGRLDKTGHECDT